MVKKVTSEAKAFDMTEYRRMKAQVVQHATAEIANKMEEVKVLLNDIVSLARDADVHFSVYDLNETMEEVRGAANGWQSSDYSC